VGESFDDALQRFQAFLGQNGRPTSVIWLTADDVVVSDNFVVYVRMTPSRASEDEARRKFETGMHRGMGVALEGLFELGDAMCAQVWLPHDQTNAEYALLGPGMVKLQIPVGDFKLSGKAVSCWLRWLYLKLRLRRHQVLKHQRFQ
jgi:hypothetical protein